VLGTGYDTRAYGSLKRDGLRTFEVDQEATQRLKRTGLERAGIDASHVTFVSVDFSRDDAFERLAQAGFDPGRKTLFLWEGVTLYLEREYVVRTLQGVRDNAPAGSTLVMDVYAQRFVDFANRPRNRKALELTGEQVSFGLPFETDARKELERLATGAGLRLGETRFLGAHDPRGPYAAVAELSI